MAAAATAMPIVTVRDIGSGAPPEQALRATEQHEDEDRVADAVLVAAAAGQEPGAEVLGDAEDDPPQHRAGHVAHAAHDDDAEGLDHRPLAHARLDREHGAEEPAGHAG